MKGENMRYLLICILLVTVILTAGCTIEKSGPGYIPKSTINPSPTSTECKYDTCSGICYYNRSQQCCGDRLYDVDDGKCCGGIIYDYYKDRGTCCDGKWYTYGTKGECCPNPSSNYLQNEQEWINTSTHHCCAGKVVSGGEGIQSGIEWQDCGNSCYNPRTHSCCGSFIHENNEIIPVKIIKEGRNSCCLGLPIPENMTCNPSDGSLVTKQPNVCTTGYGGGSCYDQAIQNMPRTPYYH
jgi:hypothetical protein